MTFGLRDRFPRFGEVLEGNFDDDDRWRFCGDCGERLERVERPRYDPTTGEASTTTIRKFCLGRHQLVVLSADGPRLP